MTAADPVDKRFIMQPETPNAYLKTKVMTASTAELRLMLFDGAIKFAEQGRVGLDAQDFEGAYNGISRCQQILMELINGLNHEADPELCRRLSGLYTYMYTRLMLASSEQNIMHVDEVLELLRYERETWHMLMEKLTEENVAATAMTTTPDAMPQTPTPSPAAVDLVGGTLCLEG